MFCEQGPKVSKEHNEPRLLIPGESKTWNPGILYLSTWILFKHLPNGNMISLTIRDIVSKQQVEPFGGGSLSIFTLHAEHKAL